MYNVKLRIGEYRCEHESHATFQLLYKTAISCAKRCYNNRVTFGYTVEDENGKQLLRVYTRNSELFNTWIARVASNSPANYNKYGLTLRHDN